MKKTIIVLATALALAVPVSAELVPLQEPETVAIGGVDFEIPVGWYEDTDYDNDTEITKLFFPPEVTKDGVYNGPFAFFDATEAAEGKDAFYILGILEAQNKTLGTELTNLETGEEGELLWITFTRTYSDGSSVERFLVFSGNEKAGSLYYTQPTTRTFAYDQYFNQFLTDLKYSQYSDVPEVAEILEHYSGQN